MNRRSYLLCALIAAALATPAPTEAQVADIPPVREITVTAEAESRTESQEAQLTFTLESTGQNPVQAAQGVEKLHHAVSAALNKSLENVELVIGGYALEGATGRGAPITSAASVRAVRSLVARTTNLTEVAQGAAAGLQAGASSVSVQYLPPPAGENDQQAIEQAVERARLKAQAAADSLGAVLGRVLSVNLSEEPPGAIIRRQMQQGKDVGLATERYTEVMATVRFEILTSVE